MQRNKLPLLLILVTMTTACSSLKSTTYHPIPSTAQMSIPTTWSTNSTNQQPVNITWLKSFNDPLLLALIKEGQKNNIDLQLTSAKMNRAWLLAAKSATALKPTVNLSIGQSQSGNFSSNDSKSSSSVGLNGSWEIDLWGRLQAGIDASQASALSAQADHRYAIHSLSANLAKSYFKVIESKRQVIISQQNSNLLQQILIITQAKYDHGLSSAQDLAVNKANLASAKDQLISLQGSQRNALRALELLLGRYPSASSEIPDQLPPLPAPPPAGIPSNMLERRPDMVSAERQIAAAFHIVKQTRAAQLPKFSLTSNINGASSSLEDVLNPANMAWQLAANLLVPLLDAGQGKIEIDLANIDQQQAVANYRQKALNAFADVEKNLDLGLVLAQRERHLYEALTQSQQAQKIATLRYAEGEIGLLDTLNLQQQAISAQSKLTSLQRMALEQRVNLYLALGGAW